MPMADRSSGVWRAIAWAESFLLVGLVAVGLAILSTWESCSFLSGCPPGESSFGRESVVWFVFSGVAVAIGIVMAALRSGWPGNRGAVQAMVALVAGAVALGLGAGVSVVLVDEYLPALVLAVGVAGTVAIRPSSPRAIRARWVTLAIFVVLAIGVANVAGLVILLALLTLPAMGAVESAIS
jgi:hypothetical protein